MEKRKERSEKLKGRKAWQGVAYPDEWRKGESVES